MNGAEGLAALALFGMIAVVLAPIAKAFARRIGGGAGEAHETIALRDEVADLRAEVDNMRGRMAQLDEMQERLDFAERVLAQAKARDALPGGRE